MLVRRTVERPVVPMLAFMRGTGGQDRDIFAVVGVVAPVDHDPIGIFAMVVVPVVLAQVLERDRDLPTPDIL